MAQACRASPSFSFRGNNYIREAMHAVFLYHAIGKGMDFGIVNPATKVAYGDIPTDQLEILEDVVLNRRADASERLVDLAEKMSLTVGRVALKKSRTEQMKVVSQ